MKQSIVLISLQTINFCLSILSLYYFASTLPPEVYAIIGVRGVICELTRTLGHLGLETHALRNILFWQRNQQRTKIRAIITIALSLRVVSWLILIPILFAYITYLEHHGYGQFKLFLLLFIPIALLQSFSDSLKLALKGFNRFIPVIILDTCQNTIARLIGLLIFLQYDFNHYMYFSLCIPILTTLTYFWLTRNYLDFRFLFSIKIAKRLITKNYNFTLQGYLNYCFLYLDNLLFSLLMHPAFFSAYNIAKTLETSARLFIEYFFNPLTQALVSIKDKPDLLANKIKRLREIKTIVLSIAICVLLPIFIFHIPNLLTLMNLWRYSGLEIFLIAASCSAILQLLAKVDYNLLGLFDRPKRLLRRDVVIGAVGAMLMIVFGFFLENRYFYFYRLAFFVVSALVIRHFLTNMEFGKQR